ncbi:hypothetical protein PIB30_082262 [Stylosanthes scabra]|uniref:Uncharacterized protein n=1 Tax=Stylosanthes scabra TaxID=79078 RepID=A0ABU6YSJ2_9FABA|nr:hypothetical protein [Stylosanthes scabra]
MVKKKSCQNVCCPRVLSVPERELYGWVDEEVFSQSSVVTSDMLLELLHEIRITEGGVSKEDYVIEAAGPSNRLPFQAAEDRTHFLWVYTKLFTHLCVQLPFTDFQKDLPPVLACFPLYLPAARSSPRKRVHVFPCSSRAKAFRVHFKVLPFPLRRPFWLDDGDKPFPWVYWNSKILDHVDVKVGVFLDSLLGDMEKQSRFDRLRQKMVEAEGVCPRSILSSPKDQTASAEASASTPATTVPLALLPALPNLRKSFRSLPLKSLSP